MDINELLKIKPENDTLKKMQHSKWATSNNLFDYNSFINDFYALIEEFNSYKDRTEPDKQSESQEVKLLDYYISTKLYLPLKSIRANFTFLSHSEKLNQTETHFLSHFG